MAGPDDYDSTASQTEVPAYSQLLEDKAPKKIAYFDTAIHHPQLDPEVRSQTQHLINDLRNQGHQVEAVPFDYLDFIIPAYYVLTTAEASSNLSRYDGVRYGYRSPEAKDLMDTYKKSRTEGFGTEVKRRIMLGTFVLSSGYYDAYYAQAQKVRRLLFDKVNAIFKDFDFIISPTTPSVAFPFGSKTDNPVEMYLSDIYTVLANLTGHPAISLPLFQSEAGLPIGMQLVSGHFEEAKLLASSRVLLSELNA
jgi:aspartyl-tRNA(Asn)/glutamyl-tRNA(Gln) amidotransferase subunit A